MQTIETHCLIITVTEENCLYGCIIANGWGETILEIPPSKTNKINACKSGLQHLTANDLQAITESN